MIVVIYFTNNSVWGFEELERAVRVSQASHVPNASAGGKERRTSAGAEIRPGGSDQQLLSTGQSRGKGAFRQEWLFFFLVSALPFSLIIFLVCFFLLKCLLR